MRAAVIGLGSVGARAARQLLASADSLRVVGRDKGHAHRVAESLGPPAQATSVEEALRGADVVVLAMGGRHRPLAEAALEQGANVVSITDVVEDVTALLGLDAEARERHLVVAVGAGFGPGLSCLLARHASAGFDAVDEIHVARFGTGGPTCARNHHRALTQTSIDWRDGAWVRRPGGSGRELCWFPDPVCGRDCYRGGLPDALLLAPSFPGVRRVTARVAASRRDRLTSWLPMMRGPHPEGLLGAIRVEVRGRRSMATDAAVLGAIDRPSVAAGAVAAVTAEWAAGSDLARAGAAGLAELVPEPTLFLATLADRGVRAAAFEGFD